MKRNHYLLLFIALLFSLTAALIYEYQKIPNNLRVYFFDIPLGDAIAIQFPDHQVMLIDGGSDPTVVAKLGEILPFWQRKLVAVMVTHPDADHLLGALQVMHRYQVANLFITGASRNFPLFNDLLDVANKRQTKLHFLSANNDFSISGSQFDILWPQASLLGKTTQNANSTSLVVRMTTPSGNSLLLTGDIEKETELELLKSPVNLRSDVLKLPHHGSKTSSSKAFLQAVKPRLAIIDSAADNPFGHPHAEVLIRLRELKIPWLQTGIIGDIVLDENLVYTGKR